MYVKKGSFLKSALALLLLAGIQTVSRAQGPIAAYSSSWAGGTSSAPLLVVGVRSVDNNGVETGSFNVATASYRAYGQCSASSVTYDLAGFHATVRANVMFNNTIPAVAIMVMSQNLDGTSSEGVEIRDAVTNTVLGSTGSDQYGNILELQVVKGSIFISPPSSPSSSS